MSLFQFWFPQGICLGVALLGHMMVLFLVFKGISISSFIVAVSICIPASNARGFPFSPHSCRLFDNGYSDWCEVVSHCSFHLHFSNNEWGWASFHMFVSHLYVLEKHLFRLFFNHLSFIYYYYFTLQYCIGFTIRQHESITGSKPERKAPIQYTNAYIWNLERR